MIEEEQNNTQSYLNSDWESEEKFQREQ